VTSDLLPEERAAALLRDRVRRVFQELPGSLAGNEEPIHQLRVAARRLRIALRLLVRGERSRRLRRALRVLRRLTRVVGHARDLDVMVGLLEDRLAALKSPSPEQRALLSRLRATRPRARARLAPALLDLDIDGVRRDLRRLQQRGPADLETVLARLLAFRQAQSAALLRGFSVLGDRFVPDALHAQRRRIRRLRYAAEVEDAFRGEDCRAPLLWKRLQEAIGGLHDRHVLALWLEERAQTAEARGNAWLARVARAERRFVIGEARRLHKAFVETRPADLALRALDASARRRGQPAPQRPGGDRAVADHPPRDRGAARDAGSPR
jgi:CHAD domain-containing protein